MILSFKRKSFEIN